MADDQIKTNIVIGLGVEGGESAAQRIAALTKQIGGLERQASQMRGLANIPMQMQDLIKSSYGAARGLASAKDQAKALTPAISAISEAVKKTGLSQDVLKSVGLDDRSLRAAGKNADGFRGLIENLAKARAKAIPSAGEYAGRAASLAAERSLLTTSLGREQRARDDAAKKAVASERATELQRTRVAMAGAQQRIAAAKSAATQTTQGDLQAARQQAATALRAVLNKAAQDPAGGAYRPTRREIMGASALPVARLGAQDGSRQTISGLQQLASAAKSASSALNALARSAKTSGGAGGAGSRGQGLIATQMMREMRSGFAKEYAQMHRMERRNEASVFPRSQYAATSGRAPAGSAGPAAAAGVMGLAKAYGSVQSSADGAAKSISQVKTQGDAITGQIKNVLGMAFGYQAIHAVASQLQQSFGHLKDGVIQFNSMLEQATVGFTTLFDNQRKQAEATNELLGKQAMGIDFIAMGYDSAADAATGVIETIREFANVTPFRFAEIQESTLRMRAFGFDMSEILREDAEAMDKFSGGIVSIGNAVAALGGGADSFRRIAYALGQMKQAGRVYQNDMMQLANAGIGGYKYIAEAIMKEIQTTNEKGEAVGKKGYEVLYKQLEGNAIETVRRLTTNGQVSGERAARAIMDGLNRDFGGGMVKQAATFQGAFSTVADMSQSLVADAFLPLYNAIRDVTYELGNFLQRDDVRERAKDFSEIIGSITEGLSWLGQSLTKIATGAANEFGNAMDLIGSKTSAAGEQVKNTFGAFLYGLGAIVRFLENEYGRAIVAAAVAAKLAFSFAQTNPFLSQLILIVSAIGAVSYAIDENLGGVGDTFSRIAKEAGPLVEALRDELIPLLLEIGGIFTQSFLGTVVIAIKALEPGIQILITAMRALLEIVKLIQVPLAAMVALLGVAFVGKAIIGGILAMQRAMIAFSRSIDGASRSIAAFNRLQAMSPANRAALMTTGSGRSARTGLGAPGAGGKIAGIAGGVGLAGVIGTGIGQQAGVVDDGIADTLNNIFGALFAFSVLKSVLPPALFKNIGDSLTGLGEGLKTFVVRLGATKAAVILLSGGAILGLIAALGLLTFAIINDQNTIEDNVQANAYATGGYLTSGGSYAGSTYTVGAYGQEDLRTFSAPDPDAIARNQAAWMKKRRERGLGEYEDRVRALEVTKTKMKELIDPQKLLVNMQNSLNKAQEKYNGLLSIAKQQLDDVTKLLEDVATSVLEDIINPKTESPYALDEGTLLEYEELLALEQELGFTQFENAQGITRSFEEYRDILDAILPLSQDETAAGEVGLKQVKERLKIEKERVRTQERIKALAEAEYDIGLATLQQYDESIDPLQRAINLRSAQIKYEKDIQDLRMRGLEDLVDEAANSRDWARLTQATNKRLEDWKAGQGLVLDEMKRMFEDYNRDIAAILADPTLSDASKKTAIETRLAQLKTDLESTFGITSEMIDNKIAEMQAQINTVTTEAGKQGHTMMVAFGDTLIKGLSGSLEGGFNSIMSFMGKKLNDVVNLSAKIRAAAEAAANVTDDVLGDIKKQVLGDFSRAGIALLKAKKAGRPMPGGGIIGGQHLAFIKKLQEDVKQANTFESMKQRRDELVKYMEMLGIPEFASGGIMQAGQMSLVGERGPELVLPQTRGLVLNNSISSRLLGMLTGKGGGGGNNVTINVNNPVIRSDNDIRKLATEISRVQASQFRTEGGRLY